jgi:glycosyltransferase involved in cell wall biosynthesis
MADTPTLSVVIPAFNEEAAIGIVLRKLCDALPDAELIVVDDGSTDKTPDRVVEAGIGRLLRHPNDRGYGAALRTGTWAASGEYVAWFDADDQHDPILTISSQCCVKSLQSR